MRVTNKYGKSWILTEVSREIMRDLRLTRPQTGPPRLYSRGKSRHEIVMYPSSDGYYTLHPHTLLSSIRFHEHQPRTPAAR